MATAQFSSPNPRVWLEIDNFSTVGHANNTGRFGEYQRGAQFGYNDETLLSFDVSSISGTVTSVSLQITCNNAGGQSVFTTTAYLYEQDKTTPGSWSSPPVYNDFANTAWSNSLQTVTVGATGSYTFTTTGGFVTYVQSWLDNSADNWGLIIAASWNALNWYLSVDAATLTVNYTPSEITQFIFMD
jgi:hypothetical protein